MNEITVNAYAKINPSLDVIGVRPDGYHEVHMLLQQIGLHDVIRLEKTRTPGIRLQIIMDDGEPPAELTADSSNLAWRAAQLLIDTYHIDEGVRMTLAKNIPVAAGLAGGSTDAAAVLKGMNILFDLHLPQETLLSHGLSLGADVPFCIMGGCALAAGIGEKLTRLPMMPPCHILLVKPPEGISTGAVYRALDAVSNPAHPDIDAAAAACSAGDLAALCSVMGNILETVTMPMLPRLSEIKASLLAAGACGAMMSGSGPTVFGLFSEASSAQDAGHFIREAYPDCRVILTEPKTPLSGS